MRSETSGLAAVRAVPGVRAAEPAENGQARCWPPLEAGHAGAQRADGATAPCYASPSSAELGAAEAKMSKLADKVFFITGASGGIGEALAREAAQQGARVVLTARRADRLERIVSEIQQEGGQATCATCDVTEPEQLRHAVGKAREAFGGIDVVIANAGFGVQGTVA